MSNSEVLHCTARSGGGGGVKLCRGTTATFDQVLFEGNRAGITGQRRSAILEKTSDTGGAIRAVGASLTMIDSHVQPDQYYTHVNDNALYTTLPRYQKATTSRHNGLAVEAALASLTNPCPTVDHFDKVDAHEGPPVKDSPVGEGEEEEEEEARARAEDRFYEIGSLLAYHGAGVHLSSALPSSHGRLVVRGGSFKGLNVEQKGAAIYANSNVAQLRPDVALTNAAASPLEMSNNRGCAGGAIAVEHARLSVSGTHSHAFQSNVAHRGGFLWSQTSKIDIQHATIQHNNASSAEPQPGCGGNILAFDHSNLTMAYSLVSAGSSRDGGGVCLLSNTIAEFTKVTITNNTAVAMGGGLHVQGNATVLMKASVVSHNDALYGGGVSLRGASLALEAGTAVHSNSVVGGDGGGLYVAEGGAVQTRNTTIEKNTATSATGTNTFGRGGGLAIAERDRLAAAAVSPSAAPSAAAAPAPAAVHDLQVTTRVHLLQGTIVQHNRGVLGGGIDVHGVAEDSTPSSTLVVRLEECLVGNNVADSGGGLYVEDATVTAKDCVVEHNQATGTKGGGAVVVTASGTASGTTTVEGRTIAAFRGTHLLLHNNSAGASDGGAVFVASESLPPTALFDLNHSTISRSMANGLGGHLYAHKAHVVMNHVHLRHGQLKNVTHGSGGSVYLTSSTLETNMVDMGHSSAYIGGCVHATASSVVKLHATTLHHCQASSVGGALNVQEQSQLVTTTGVTTTGVTTTGVTSLGSATAKANASATASVNVIHSNHAESGAGLFLTTHSHAHVVGALFQDNVAEGEWGGDGAACFVTRATLHVENRYGKELVDTTSHVLYSVILLISTFFLPPTTMQHVSEQCGAKCRRSRVL